MDGSNGWGWLAPFGRRAADDDADDEGRREELARAELGCEIGNEVDGVEYGWPAGWVAPGGVFEGEWKAAEDWAEGNAGWAICESDARLWYGVEFDSDIDCCSPNRGICSGPVVDEGGPSPGERDAWVWLVGDGPDGGVGYRFGLKCCRYGGYRCCCCCTGCCWGAYANWGCW